MADIAVIKEMETYLKSAYASGRADKMAREIAKKYLQNIEQTLLYVKLSCSFIEGARGWRDLEKRYNSARDPFQFSSKFSGGWFDTNKDVLKNLAKEIKKLISALGLPADNNDLKTLRYLLGNKLNISLTERKGFIFKKEIAKPKERILLELEAKIASL